MNPILDGPREFFGVSIEENCEDINYFNKKIILTYFSLEMKSKSETEDNYSCKLQKDVQEIAKQELKVNSIQNIFFSEMCLPQSGMKFCIEKWSDHFLIFFLDPVYGLQTF